MDKAMSARIKALGFFMTCGMVVYHTVWFVDNSMAVGPGDAFLNHQIDTIFYFVGALVMNYFFTITGFLLFQHYSLAEYPRKIKRRLFSLLIPYLLWQLLVGLYDGILGRDSFTVASIFRRVFLFVTWPMDGPLWYLYVVFLLALLSPLLLPLFRNRKLGWISVLLMVLALELRGLITAPGFVNAINYGYCWNILNYLPCYLVGAFYGYFSSRDKEPVSLVYAFSLVLLAYLLEGLVPEIASRMVVKMMPLGLLLLLPSLPLLENRRIYNLTFLVYAMHDPLIREIWPRLAHLYVRVSWPVSLKNLLLKSAVLLVDLLLAALIHWFLRRFAPKLLALLTGGRY